MEDHVKALSIRQPWAWEIVHGIKVVEFRSWSTNYQGPLLIHAPKTIDFEWLSEERKWLASYDIGLPENLDHGGIVGIATLEKCVKRSEPGLWRRLYNILLDKRPSPGIAPRRDSNWFSDNYGFILKDVQTLPFERYPGKLGFFDVPTAILDGKLEF